MGHLLRRCPTTAAAGDPAEDVQTLDGWIHASRSQRLGSNYDCPLLPAISCSSDPLLGHLRVVSCVTWFDAAFQTGVNIGSRVTVGAIPEDVGSDFRKFAHKPLQRLEGLQRNAFRSERSESY